jgi:hypothetical protein
MSLPETVWRVSWAWKRARWRDSDYVVVFGDPDALVRLHAVFAEHLVAVPTPVVADGDIVAAASRSVGGARKNFSFHNPPKNTTTTHFVAGFATRTHSPEVRDDGGTGGGGERRRAERLQQVGQQSAAVVVFGADGAEHAEARAAVAVEGVVVVEPRQGQLVVLVVGAHHADLVVPVCGRRVFVDAQCAVVQL